MSSIAPCIWFNGEAEDAVSFYISLFPNSSVGSISRYAEGAPLPAGTADGGSEERCGWLKDWFGVSWQVVPDGFGQLISDRDPARAKRALQAMTKMQKLDLAFIRAAADGK